MVGKLSNLIALAKSGLLMRAGMQILTGSLRIVWIALGTGAVGDRSNCKLLNMLRFDPQQAGDLIDHLKNFRANQAVEDIAAIPVRGHQFGFAQDHQMLRDTRLASAQYCLQVADAGLFGANDQENLDSGRLTDQRKISGNLFLGSIGN
jgi:hypothetical protein